MINLTPKAVDKVKEILAAEEKPDWGLRVGLKQGGCSGFTYMLAIDEKPADNDQVIEYDGLKIFIDENHQSLLSGIQLDYIDDLTGQGFKFSNPNATRSCGCGKSFDA